MTDPRWRNSWPASCLTTSVTLMTMLLYMLVQTVYCFELARVEKHVLARVETHVLARVLLHVLDYYSKTCGRGTHKSFRSHMLNFCTPRIDKIILLHKLQNFIQRSCQSWSSFANSHWGEALAYYTCAKQIIERYKNFEEARDLCNTYTVFSSAIQVHSLQIWTNETAVH